MHTERDMPHKTTKPDRVGDGRVSPTAPRERSLSAAIWDHLESQPAFNDAIREGERQIAAGQSVKFAEVRRRR